MAHDPPEQGFLRTLETKVTCLLSSGSAECKAGWILREHLDLSLQGSWDSADDRQARSELDYVKSPSRFSIRWRRKIC